MGCMGMSMDDFCRCIPSEFYATYEAWHEMQQQREQSRWERMRMQCLCSLQPYSKDKLKPQDVMQFPWEKEELGADAQAGREELSHEELMARYRKAKAELGL